MPGLKRAAILFNPDTAPYAEVTFLPAFEAASLALKIVPTIAPVRSDDEIETAITDLGREPLSGLIVMPDLFTTAHRAPIISAAARNNIPTVYFFLPLPETAACSPTDPTW